MKCERKFKRDLSDDTAADRSDESNGAALKLVNRAHHTLAAAAKRDFASRFELPGVDRAARTGRGAEASVRTPPHLNEERKNTAINPEASWPRRIKMRRGGRLRIVA